MVRDRTVVLGRDDQWAALDNAVHATGQPGALLMVRGPGGAGKTALLDAAVQHWSRHDVQVVSVTATTDANVDEALLDEVRGHVGTRSDPGLLRAIASAARLRPADRTTATALPFLHELTVALTHLVRRTRSVLVLEDVDRIPGESAAAFALLVQGVRAAGGVVITTARTGRHPVADQLAAVSDQVVDLPPLTDEDVVTLIGRWTGGRNAVDPTVPAALRCALGPLFGNPGTVRSTLRALRERLIIVDEHVCLRSAEDPVALPADHELVRAVADCGDHAELVAWGTAVLNGIGADDLPSLTRAADVDLHASGRALDRLLDRGVLRLDDDDQARPLVPALAATLLQRNKRDPRRVHQSIAQQLMDQTEQGLPVDKAALADHLAQAGSDFPDRWGLDLLIDEADRVVRRDPLQAGNWYRAALHGLPPSDSRWSRVLRAMMRLQAANGHYRELADDIGTLLPRLVDSVSRTGADEPHLADDPALLVEVAVCWLAALMHEERVGEMHEFIPLFDLLAERSRCDGEMREFYAALFRGRMREAVDALNELIAAVHGAPGPPERPAIAVGDVLLMLNTLVGDDDEFQRAHALRDRTAPPDAEHGPAEVDLGRLRDAGGLLDHATVLELILGDRYGRPDSGILRNYQDILRAYHAGHWDAALSLAREMEASRHRSLTSPARHLARVVAAEICSARGDFRRAEEWLSDMPPNLASGYLASWVLCGLRFRRGEAELAVAEGWKEYLRHRRDGTVAGIERLLGRLIDYSLQLGEHEQAERILSDLEQLDARLRTSSTREALLITAGMVHGDENMIRGGVDLARQRGDAFRVTRGCVALGELVEEPQPWLHEAHALAKRLGSVRSRALINEVMRRRGVALPRSRSPRAPLSPTEVHIVDLVSDGFTNRQIAMAVQISEKTVESHLTRLFARTGCRSRVELAAARLDGRLAGAAT